MTPRHRWTPPLGHLHADDVAAATEDVISVAEPRPGDGSVDVFVAIDGSGGCSSAAPPTRHWSCRPRSATATWSSSARASQNDGMAAGAWAVGPDHQDGTLSAGEHHRSGVFMSFDVL
jgi:hypothetical protein